MESSLFGAIPEGPSAGEGEGANEAIEVRRESLASQTPRTRTARIFEEGKVVGLKPLRRLSWHGPSTVKTLRRAQDNKSGQRLRTTVKEIKGEANNEGNEKGGDEEEEGQPIPCAFPMQIAAIVVQYLPHPHCYTVAIRLPLLEKNLSLWRSICQRKYPITQRRGKGKRRKYRKKMQESNSALFWRKRYSDSWNSVLRSRVDHAQRIRDLQYRQNIILSRRSWAKKTKPIR